MEDAIPSLRAKLDALNALASAVVDDEILNFTAHSAGNLGDGPFATAKPTNET